MESNEARVAAPRFCDPEVDGNSSLLPGLEPFEAKSGYFGYRDPDGKVRIEPRFLAAYHFSREGLAAAIEMDGPVFIDTSGRVVARSFNYDNGPDDFACGLARIVDDAGRIGFIARNGKVVVAPRYDFAFSFSEGLAAVALGGEESGEHGPVTGARWGYIDTSGEEVIPLDFDDASPFSDGTAQVLRAGRRFRIDGSGKALE